MALDVTEVTVGTALRWVDEYPEPSERGQPSTWSGHRLHRILRGVSETMAVLEVFRLDSGTVARWFGRPITVSLLPLSQSPQGPCVPMRDLDMVMEDTLPNNDLLTHEPGTFLYIAPNEPRGDLRSLAEIVDLSLGIEPEIFDGLVDDLVRAKGRVTRVRLETRFEGWQERTEAFHAPSGPYEVIGLLATSDRDNTAAVRVRLESTTVTYGVTALLPVAEPQG